MNALDLHRMGHGFARGAKASAKRGDLDGADALHECANIAWDECDKRLVKELRSLRDR